MNTFSYNRSILMCEEADLRDVANRYGTPLYVYSKQSIVHCCREIEQAFDGNGHLTCYAVKANNNVMLMEILAREGLGADVASHGELALALQAGFLPANITMSGVGKSDVDICKGLEAGIKFFSVESLEELHVVSGLAVAAGKVAQILLRVNLDIEAGDHAYIVTSASHSKFGIPLGTIAEVARVAMTLPGIHLRGLHSHLGSQILDIEALVLGAREVLTIIRDLRSAGIPVEHIDYGGGFGVQYRGLVQHPMLPNEQPEEGNLLPAESIRPVATLLQQSGCSISIQPGRALVAQSCALVVRALYRKEMEDKVFIIVDGGMNDLIRPALYQAHHQVVPVSIAPAGHERVDVVGPLCESGDFFAQDRMLPRAQRGDLLAVMCAGAYGYALASNYNSRPRAVEVMIDGATCTVIREREQVEELSSGKFS